MPSLRRGELDTPPEPEVSVRILLVAAVAAAIGTIGWRFPFTVNPMLLVVATFAVLDKVTGRAKH